jgi:hypothetical protein
VGINLAVGFGAEADPLHCTATMLQCDILLHPHDCSVEMVSWLDRKFDDACGS